MDDSGVVRGFKRFRNLPREWKCFIERNRPSLDSRGEILSLDEFHHQRRRLVGALEAVNRGDVRVIERGQGLGFTLKSREPVGVGSQRRGQHLQRDVSFEIRIEGAIHLAHAADADGSLNLVGAEARAWSQYHRDGAEYKGGLRAAALDTSRRSRSRGMVAHRRSGVILRQRVKMRGPAGSGVPTTRKWRNWQTHQLEGLALAR